MSALESVPGYPGTSHRPTQRCLLAQVGSGSGSGMDRPAREASMTADRLAPISAWSWRLSRTRLTIPCQCCWAPGRQRTNRSPSWPSSKSSTISVRAALPSLSHGPPNCNRCCLRSYCRAGRAGFRHPAPGPAFLDRRARTRPAEWRSASHRWARSLHPVMLGSATHDIVERQEVRGLSPRRQLPKKD